MFLLCNPSQNTMMEKVAMCMKHWFNFNTVDAHYVATNNKWEQVCGRISVVARRFWFRWFVVHLFSSMQFGFGVTAWKCLVLMMIYRVVCLQIRCKSKDLKSLSSYIHTHAHTYTQVHYIYTIQSFQIYTQ